MTNKTLPLLDAGSAISDVDLFLTRQGSDTVDKKVTGTQLKTFLAAPERLTVTFDGGGDELIDNSNVFTRMSYAGTITAVTLLCDVVGDLSIDVQKDTFANFPPDGTDSIGTVAITGVDKLYDNTLSGWSDVNFSAGDVLRFNIDSCTDITHAVLVLTIQY